MIDIETDQSCKNEGVHKPILLVTESLTGESNVYIGYDCINEFCNAVFNSSERIQKTERLLHISGAGLIFYPFWNGCINSINTSPKSCCGEIKLFPCELAKNDLLILIFSSRYRHPSFQLLLTSRN